MNRLGVNITVYSAYVIIWMILRDWTLIAHESDPLEKNVRYIWSIGKRKLTVKNIV